MNKSRIEIVPVNSKFHVVIDSNTTSHKAGSQAAAQITIDRIIKQMGSDKIIQIGLGTIGSDHAGDAGENPSVEFDINERFLFLTHIVGMVAKGETNAAIIVGQGGLGKTHTVIESLRDSGFSDIDKMISEAPEGAHFKRAKTFKFIKGYSTGKHLYRQLYEGNDSVIVFDDCDSIQKDMNSLNILKSALDSYGTRVVSWGAEPINGSDLPTSFIFTGRIIFISNMAMRTWDSAVKSRCMTVDVHMTKAQIMDRMRHMVESDTFMPEYDQEMKEQALEIIDTCKDHIKDLNLRTLVKATQARVSAQGSGSDAFCKQLVTYLLTN